MKATVCNVEGIVIASDTVDIPCVTRIQDDNVYRFDKFQIDASGAGVKYSTILYSLPTMTSDKETVKCQGNEQITFQLLGTAGEWQYVLCSAPNTNLVYGFTKEKLICDGKYRKNEHIGQIRAYYWVDESI